MRRFILKEIPQNYHQEETVRFDYVHVTEYLILIPQGRIEYSALFNEEK